VSAAGRLDPRARGDGVEDLRRLQRAGLVCSSGDFFPSVHYPPITMIPPVDERELFRGYAAPADGLFDVYAHFPFCAARCLFCHYPALYGDQRDEKDRYLAAIERELDLHLRRLGVERLAARSILVGGGTPTALSPRQLERFLTSFVARLDLSRCEQFSYDVDPSTLLGDDGLERLRLLRDHGVGRLTIGVQSLDDATLRLMNRTHGAREALQSIENARGAGFQLNLDFIFGHPGDTLDSWSRTVDRAAALGVEEIQLYRLKIQPYGDLQGAIARYRQAGPEGVPAAEDAIRMKEAAIDLLGRHGYRENLRRVFTRERGHYSRYAHDQCCELYDQLGVGLTAFSSLRDRFALNTQRFDEYYARIAEGRLPVNRGLVRSEEQQLRWAIALPLKNRSVRKRRFRERTGVGLEEVFRAKIAALAEFGLVVEDQRELALTPLGAFFADEVATSFNHPDHLPFPRAAYREGPLNPFLHQRPR
jgi:oxygen-independent coproporphyrinogen-3 oxidase